MSEYTLDLDHKQSYGPVEKKFFTFADPPNQMRLESAAKLGPITLAYETYGQLNKDKSNAVLILHALTGDSHATGFYTPNDAKPGWWEIMIGSGKGIDTDQYFVICANILGGCQGSTGPGSINQATEEPYGKSFPLVTIGDMVRAQKRLVKFLGIERLEALVGGSLGGMQVLEWTVRYPDMVNKAVVLASCARHSALAIAFNEVARQAIISDPNWHKGNYYHKTAKPDHGLAVARMIGHITYLSDEAMKRKFGRRLQDREDLSFDFEADFQVESYLRYQGRKFVERFDANSFLVITKAADYFDLKNQHGNGSLINAFAKAKAKFLVVSFTSDWLYPTYQSKEIVRALKKCGLSVSFCEIEADYGHDAFLLPNDDLSRMISSFLAQTSAKTEKT